MEMLGLFIMSLAMLVLCLAADKNLTQELFITWFTHNGGVVNNIELADFGSMGRGVRAASTVEKGDMLLRIPRKIMLSMDTLKEAAETDKIYKRMLQAKGISRDEMIATFLMIEKIRGPASFFEPYIAMLPEYVPSLVHFNNMELNQLDHPEFSAEVQREQSHVTVTFEKIKRTLAPVLSTESDVSVGVPISSFTLSAYMWATTNIDSRALRFRGEIYLAPFACMFNYLHHSEVRTSAAGEFYLQHHKLGAAALEILADRSQVKGGQVFEDYGDNSDKIYMRYHGFMPSENPFRCIILGTEAQIEVLRAEALTRNPDLALLLTAIRLQNMAEGHISHCVDASGDLGRPLTIFLLALSMTQEEAEACLPSVRRADEGSVGWATAFEHCGFTAAIALFKARLGGVIDREIAENPLVRRFLVTARELLRIRDAKWSSSIQQDDALLRTLNVDSSGKARSRATDSDISDMHFSLAIRYRKAMKIHTRQLVDLYDRVMGVNFSSSHSTTSTTTSISVLRDERSMVIETKLSPEGDVSLQSMLDDFNAWFASKNPQTNLLKAVASSQFRIGTEAIRDIEPGEVYLAVPSAAIIDGSKAFADEVVGALLQSLEEKYKRRDDTHEVIFMLMRHYFTLQNSSEFWPYLRLLPRPAEMDNPLMWPNDQLVTTRLAPSFIADTVLNYRLTVRKTFEAISKIELIKNFLTESNFSISEYTWATAILDSRSIWWNGHRHLVPMLDFVNCREGPDPTRLHSTLQEGDFAVTRAPWRFDAGQEVFENYGQPNHVYFTYHGFSLTKTAGEREGKDNEGDSDPDNGWGNTHDCVQLALTLDQSEIENLDKTVATDLAKKFGLRSLKSVQFCLGMNTPIPASVGLFLGFKLNDYRNYEVNEEYQSPSRASRALLMRLIEQRLALYRQHGVTVTGAVSPSPAAAVDATGDTVPYEDEEDEDVHSSSLSAHSNAADSASTGGPAHESSYMFLQSEFRLLSELKNRLLASLIVDKQ